eukprot:13505801-Alexandrium_andersonii.AAC.1
MTLEEPTWLLALRTPPALSPPVPHLGYQMRRASHGSGTRVERPCAEGAHSAQAPEAVALH